jgi:rhodanese-related sulfurtransferase
LNALTTSALKSFVPFHACSEGRLGVLLNRCERFYASKGQVLMEPGKAQNHAVFLLSGSIRCGEDSNLIDPDFSYPLHYRYIYREKLVAMTDCSFFRIERDWLDRLLCWSESVHYLEEDIACQKLPDKDQEWMVKLLNSNLFYKVSPINLPEIFIHLSAREVKSGEVIIRQGDTGDYCYFIKQGTASVSRQPPGEKQPVLVAQIGVGQCFGEDALLHETVRNATVTMESDGVLLRIEKRDFLQLLREPEVDTLSGRDLDMALKSDAVLLDVRTVEEYRYRHLKSAFSLPLGSMKLLARTLDPYAYYVTYCDTDRRSRTAARFLATQGYRVRALVGGLNHLPVEQYQIASSL